MNHVVIPERLQEAYLAVSRVLIENVEDLDDAFLAQEWEALAMTDEVPDHEIEQYPHLVAATQDLREAVEGEVRRRLGVS